MEVPVLCGPACARCGDDLDSPGQENSSTALCRACRLAPPAFERAVAYAFYQDPMRAVIHALKYGHMHPAARRMGRMLAQAIAQLAGEAPAEMLVVPIPLHRSRQAERGFNQARLLAAHALKALGTSHPEWKLTLAPAALMRLRATESQASLTTRERRMNVRGAFSVSEPASVRNRHVLLIDDILTTGATARAAAQALKRAGAATVWVATLARARRVYRGPAGAVLDQLDTHDKLETHNGDFGPSDTQGDSAGENETAQPQQHEIRHETQYQTQQRASVDESSMNQRPEHQRPGNQPSF
jgi:ComF family protein